MSHTVQFQDSNGWHSTPYAPGMDSPEALGIWACFGNDSLCRLINRGQLSRDSMSQIITRVIVTRTSDGAKVAEWPVVEGVAI